MTTAERGPQDSETANVIRRTTAARLGALALAAALAVGGGLGHRNAWGAGYRLKEAT
jgi:hypothetical protein